ncbi:MAG: hypothetical protein HY985_12800 [Magnetospirillum sp.]|nr:hypothetical protein [Magnetospirillum sp.]
MRQVPLRLAAAAIMLAPGLAAAAVAGDDPFAALTPLGHEELGSLRGGMMIGGIPVDFAVVIRTTVTGAMAPMGLQTVLSVANDGSVGASSTIPIGVGDAVSMTLSGDGTSIIHRVAADHMEAIIANTRSDVSINHSTEFNVTMPGFQAMSQSHVANSHVARMGYESSLVGLGRF